LTGERQLLTRACTSESPAPSKGFYLRIPSSYLRLVLQNTQLQRRAVPQNPRLLVRACTSVTKVAGHDPAAVVRPVLERAAGHLVTADEDVVVATPRAFVDPPLDAGTHVCDVVDGKAPGPRQALGPVVSVGLEAEMLQGAVVPHQRLGVAVRYLRSTPPPPPLPSAWPE
jgi:hypothetical protein